MKVSVLLAGLVWPVLAFGQQTYTNADLAKFDVPGAYSNEDLKRLPPTAVQKQPIATPPAYVPPTAGMTPFYQQTFDRLGLTRSSLSDELDFEMGRVDFSESGFAGDARTIEPRLGYRARTAALILELQKRIVLLDRQMDDLRTQAGRDGVTIDPRGVR